MRAEAITDASALDGTKGQPALVVKQLTKCFAERTAFSDVSFQVAYGEVFGFLGPNGAGKTTTVRTLGTLIAPTSGSATVAGIPLSPENGVEIRQRISVMPESPGLYLRLTVTENLEYFAGLYGLHQAGARIKDALDAVNLGDRAGDLCGGLSKGLRQRVGLARTLLSNPAIMFLDEPTSGLDPVAARDVHDLIDGLRQKGVTIFLTTHRLEETRLCGSLRGIFLQRRADLAMALGAFLGRKELEGLVASECVEQLPCLPGEPLVALGVDHERRAGDLLGDSRQRVVEGVEQIVGRR